MRRRVAWFLAFLAVVGLADEERPKTKDELSKEALAPYKGMVEFVGSARITDTGLKSAIAHNESFQRTLRGKTGDRKSPAARLTAHFEKTGRYDFSLLLKAPEIKAWAREKKLDAKVWMRQLQRAQLLQTRLDLQDGLEEHRKRVEKLEKDAAAFEFDDLREAAEEARWILTLIDKTIELIPAPNATEKKALEKHANALRLALSGAGKVEAR